MHFYWSAMGSLSKGSSSIVGLVPQKPKRTSCELQEQSVTLGMYCVLCPKRRGNGAKHFRGTVPRHQAWIEDVPKQHSTRWHPKSAWKCPGILKEKTQSGISIAVCMATCGEGLCSRHFNFKPFSPLPFHGHHLLLFCFRRNRYLAWFCTRRFPIVWGMGIPGKLCALRHWCFSCWAAALGGKAKVCLLSWFSFLCFALLWSHFTCSGWQDIRELGFRITPE